MRAFLLHAVLAALLTSTALARTEFIYTHGACDDGGQWWSVTTYDNGSPVEVMGMDCNGVRYDKLFCSFTHLTENPFGGAEPSATGICGGGMAWKALLSYDSSHMPTGIVGLNCAGEFYSASLTAGNPIQTRSCHPEVSPGTTAPKATSGRLH